VVAPLVDDEDDDLFNAALDAIEAREREKNLKRELDLVREQLRLAHERELFRNQFDSELYSSGLISAAALLYEDVSTASTQQSVVAHVHEPSQHLPQQPIPQQPIPQQPIPQQPQYSQLDLPPTATAPHYTPSQRIIATSGAAITSTARDVKKKKTVNFQDMNIDSEVSKKRENMSTTSNQAQGERRRNFETLLVKVLEVTSL
jgi:hypothetical protein